MNVYYRLSILAATVSGAVLHILFFRYSEYLDAAGNRALQPVIVHYLFSVTSLAQRIMVWHAIIRYFSSLWDNTPHITGQDSSKAFAEDN